MNDLYDKSVIVTGTSTGIGKSTALYLSEQGFHVLAGVRKKQDMKQFKPYENISPVIIDVTKEETIKETLDFVKEKEFNLFGLVNNAGIVVGGPLLEVPMNQVLDVFNVNVFGALRMIQTFGPLIMKNKGRIVNVSSVSGRIASPFLGPYAMSKFALEAMSDSLRRELGYHGVKVIVVQPGPVKTPIWDKSDPDPPLYHDSIFRKIAVKRAKKMIINGKTKGIEPIVVAKTIYKALTAKRPKTRYLVARNKIIYRLGSILPDKLVDKFI